MKQYTILKFIGLAMLTMITLVIISVLEVTLYSYVINPGHDESFYEAHAQLTAPYVSCIFGFIVFFLVARYWKRKGFQNLLRLIILFPLIYVLLDIIIITVAVVQWSDYILIFSVANGAKFLGSYLGYKLTKSKQAFTLTK
jgi:hypothetical protein